MEVMHEVFCSLCNIKVRHRFLELYSVFTGIENINVLRKKLREIFSHKTQTTRVLGSSKKKGIKQWKPFTDLVLFDMEYHT